MNLGLKVLFISLLTSCAASGYQRSYIMGDSNKIEISNEPITHLDRKSFDVK